MKTCISAADRHPRPAAPADKAVRALAGPRVGKERWQPPDTSDSGPQNMSRMPVTAISDSDSDIYTGAGYSLVHAMHTADECIPTQAPGEAQPVDKGEGEIEMTHDNGPQTDMQGGQGRVRAQGKQQPQGRACMPTT
jgi:hypothetical protein